MFAVDGKRRSGSAAGGEVSYDGTAPGREYSVVNGRILFRRCRILHNPCMRPSPTCAIRGAIQDANFAERTWCRDLEMPEYDDFQEIAHCGGQATFHIICDDHGRKSYSIGFRHSRPVPAAVIVLYALAPQGIPVADFSIGGIRQGFNPSCPEGCFRSLWDRIRDSAGATNTLVDRR